MLDRTRRWLRAALALTAVTATSLAMAGAPSSAAPPNRNTSTPAIQPLPADLEQIRQAEAVKLYGSPEIRPPDQRRTSITTLGDSEISGEGVGNYEPGTHGPDNWCDRSLDAAVHRTGIPVDLTLNLACSGGRSANLVYRSGEHQYDDLNQGDNLAVKARNTRLKLVWIVVSANDHGGVEFGPVLGDCVKRRVFFQGNCWPDYTDGWQQRVDRSRAGAEQAVRSVRQTMRDAGYADGDYQLVLMSYPTPAGPDVEDNPNFPGWYGGGCLAYLKDMAFARNKAVPLFGQAIRRAAENTGARFLDASRLFDGHEVCSDNTWARGLHIENGNILDPHAVQQSFHPNDRGHAAFASCMAAFYANPRLPRATCVDPASTGSTVLLPGLLDFRQLRNPEAGLCADAEGYNARNGTALLTWTCHGGRNQGFWYDEQRRSVHSELTHDRCVDVPNQNFVAGQRVQLWNCNGSAAQTWTVDGGRLRPTSNPDLCLSTSDTSKGSALVLSRCDGGKAQQWASETRTKLSGYGHKDWIPSRAY
ncbi:ricin-type beta-trefoil lectin domain protein [Streptoalloteichus hindustanus]|uniref:GDSL-like Lipase/Acylhydrolase family protein n=1 Tax=Streptoalloteichus hindustanus TaxID=2017 RepID=A0A1M5GLB6_STRHI|nr:ricin-type beta-trefoil lectin domain protein [Streptoalloteichus hindustanus]SHG04488.1 GDSL-like Lipase/Acylhydrolase family protein [Streptoalloteichus hindustanus]